MKTKYFIFFIAPLLSLVSCNNTTNTKNPTCYLGGEIINPSINYVILYDNESLLDTLYLDENNRFFKKYDSLETGLYWLQHLPESQMIFFEPGDSLLLRVNTIEFDESLVFSGRGAEKNNFLIDMFLENERERTQINTYFTNTPAVFEEKIDSLTQLRLKRYTKFLSKIMVSEHAQKVCKSSFLSHYYASKESYPMQHFNTNISDANDKFDAFPKSFYDYRKQLNPNDDALINSYDFIRFLNAYIENEVYMNFARLHNFKEKEPNVTLSRLDLIDSLFDHKYLKERMLFGVTRDYLAINEDRKASKHVLEHYLSKATNASNIKNIKTIAEANTKLQLGDVIPDQTLISSTGTTIALSDLLRKNKTTAIYFWSTLDIQYYKKAHAKVTELRKKYPDIHFIAINIDEDKTKKWINILDQYNYHPDYEYQFEDVDKSKKELILLFFTRGKTIIVGDNGKILNPNANIFQLEYDLPEHHDE